MPSLQNRRSASRLVSSRLVSHLPPFCPSCPPGLSARVPHPANNGVASVPYSEGTGSAQFAHPPRLGRSPIARPCASTGIIPCSFLYQPRLQLATAFPFQHCLPTLPTPACPADLASPAYLQVTNSPSSSALILPKNLQVCNNSNNGGAIPPPPSLGHSRYWI